MATPSADELQKLVTFLDEQLMELARSRGRLSFFEDRGLRFQAQIRRDGSGRADDRTRQDGREMGKEWLAQHDPNRVVEVTSTLVVLARELVRLAQHGYVPDYWLEGVWDDLLRAARLWEGAEGFRPEWKDGRGA